MLEKSCKEIANNLQSKYGAPLDWTMILELIMQIIDDCFNNEQDFINAAKTPTFLQRAVFGVQARRACRDNGIRTRYASNLRDEVFDYCSGCVDDELSAIYTTSKVAFYESGFEGVSA